MKVYGTGDVPGRSDVNAMVSDMYTQTLKNRISKESILTKKRNFPALVSQMFEAVAVLASKNIIHRDLHSGNIMFGPDPYHNPKIIDFGWSEDTQGRKFKPFTFDEKQPYRLYHPPEQRQWSRILQSYSYRKCTTKFDVYSMAAALIELIYDRTKNDSSLLRSFETLMLSCLFGLSGVELFRNSYGYLDGFDTHRRQHGRANIYPSDSRIVGVVEVVDSRDIYSCFRESGGGVHLVLHMPRALGNTLKRCLRFERARPTARQVVQTLQGNVSSSYSSSSNFAPLRM